MKVFSSSSLPFGQRKESEFLILRLSPARNKFAYLFCWIWNRDSVFFPKTSTTLPCCHTQLLRKFSVQAVYPLNKKMKSISKFWYSRLQIRLIFWLNLKPLITFCQDFASLFSFMIRNICGRFQVKQYTPCTKAAKEILNFELLASWEQIPLFFLLNLEPRISFYPNRPSHFSLMTRSSSESFQFKHITLCIKPAWNQHVSWN